MTTNTTDGQVAIYRSLAKSKRRLSQLQDALEQRIDLISVGDKSGLKDLNLSIEQLAKFSDKVEEGGAELDRIAKRKSGRASDIALDLEEARSEIRCRLACLRDARTNPSVL